MPEENLKKYSSHDETPFFIRDHDRVLVCYSQFNLPLSEFLKIFMFPLSLGGMGSVHTYCHTHGVEPIVQRLSNFPAFYGTRRFITVFTRALHWSLS
jgi:hypothetical protein